MNEILNAMKTRRSVRKFAPTPVAPELLRRIEEAGLYAASGMNRQSPVILTVTDPAKRARLTDVNREIGGWPVGFDPFYGAPVIMIVLVPKACFTGIYDGSLVIGNLMLAAHALGLGSIWIHRAKEEFERTEYQELLRSLGLEGEWEGVGHCAIGYAADPLPPPPERKPNRVFHLD